MVSQKNLKIYDDEKRKGRPFPCKEDKSFKHKENNKRISTVYNLLENNHHMFEGWDASLMQALSRTHIVKGIHLSVLIHGACSFFFSRVPQFERAAEDRVTSAKILEKKRRRRKAKKSLDVEISSVSIPTYAQNTSFSTQNFLSLRNWAIFDFLVVIFSEKKDKIWTLMIINNSKRLFKQFIVCCSCWI